MYQLDPSATSLDWVSPPTQDTLLCDDGIPMETYRHKLQMDLLVEPLNTWLVLEQNRGFVGGNMFVYFSPNQVRNQDYRGPDVFAVMDVAIGERKSWVVWEEGKAPDIVIELLPDSTATQDKTEKKLRQPRSIDQSTSGLSFSPLARLLQRGGNHMAALDQENRIQAQQQAEQAQQQAEQAQQQAEQAQQQAEQAQQQAEQEHQRAEQERRRADVFAARLRTLGIDSGED